MKKLIAIVAATALVASSFAIAGCKCHHKHKHNKKAAQTATQPANAQKADAAAPAADQAPAQK